MQSHKIFVNQIGLISEALSKAILENRQDDIVAISEMLINVHAAQINFQEIN